MRNISKKEKHQDRIVITDELKKWIKQKFSLRFRKNNNRRQKEKGSRKAKYSIGVLEEWKAKCIWWIFIFPGAMTQETQSEAIFHVKMNTKLILVINASLCER